MDHWQRAKVISQAQISRFRRFQDNSLFTKRTASRPGVHIRRRRFRYDSLINPTSNLRILILCPGKFEDEIYCHLAYSAINSSGFGDYEAVSYAWGNPEYTHNIRLSPSTNCPIFDTMDKAVFYNFPVTYTVHCALKRFRFPDRHRRLWLDAICINQSDVRECGQQVQLMGQLYSQASSVLVWLGDYVLSPNKQSGNLSESSVTVAFRYLEDFDKARAESQLPQTIPTVSEHKITESISATLRDVYRRPWFRRLWVLQEVVLPQRSIYAYLGLEKVTLERLLLASSLADHDAWLETHAMYGMRYHIRTPEWKSMSVVDRVIWALESTSGQFQFKKTHDRLYAVLGIIGETSGCEDLVPDYQKPIDAFYIDLARYIFRASGTFRILAGAHCQPGSGLPSWVPIWRSSGVRFEDGDERKLDRTRYFTSFSFSDCGRVMHARLRWFGQVESVCSLCLPKHLQDLTSFHRHLRQLREDVTGSSSVRSKYQSQSDRHRAFDNLLVSIVHFQRSPRDRFAKEYKVFTEAPEPYRRRDTEGERHLIEVFTGLTSSWVLSTSIGLLGFSSCSSDQLAREDEIYLAPGCLNAFALRRDVGGLRIVNTVVKVRVHPCVAGSLLEHLDFLRFGAIWKDVTIA